MDKTLSDASLIELARLTHQFETKGDDIGFLAVMTEVEKREAQTEFNSLYRQLWPEFAKD